IARTLTDSRLATAVKLLILTRLPPDTQTVLKLAVALSTSALTLAPAETPTSSREATASSGSTATTHSTETGWGISFRLDARLIGQSGGMSGSQRLGDLPAPPDTETVTGPMSAIASSGSTVTVTLRA